jgi:hypothetical protein
MGRRFTHGGRVDNRDTGGFVRGAWGSDVRLYRVDGWMHRTAETLDDVRIVATRYYRATDADEAATMFERDAAGRWEFDEVQVTESHADESGLPCEDCGADAETPCSCDSLP